MTTGVYNFVKVDQVFKVVFGLRFHILRELYEDLVALCWLIPDLSMYVLEIFFNPTGNGGGNIIISRYYQNDFRIIDLSLIFFYSSLVINNRYRSCTPLRKGFQNV